MRGNRSKPAAAFAVVVGIGLGVVGIEVLNAQQAAAPPAIKRTVLLKQESTSCPDRDSVMLLVELPPVSTEGKHTHPGELYGYVLEGNPTLDIEGQGTRNMKPGDVFFIAPGQVHEGSNRTKLPAKISVVLVAEKGKQLSTPAP